MLASYEANFAASWGRKVRNTIEEHGNRFFRIQIDPSSSAADTWAIEGRRGGMVTAGVGGALTGKGADLLIIDDPVKNMKEAQSETVRRNQWEWYKSTFRTRLEPGGIVLLIGTRWHEDDLLGRVIEEMEEDPYADKFLIVRLPALAEEPSEDYPEPDALGRKPGEALFPERYPADALEPHKSNAYTWGALYQQRPAPEEGGVFEKDWFEVVPYPALKMKKVVRRWDAAATDPKAGEDPDYCVGLKLGLGEDGNYYILDIVRERMSPGKLDRLFRSTCRVDGYTVRQRMEQEPGSAGKIAIWHLARGPFRGYAFRGVRNTGPKPTRADTVSSAAEHGMIKVVKARWNKDFFYEVTRYPNAAHDDQVDALGGAFEDLTKRSTGLVAL
jgi:predicted phage terminase large subunit-like protein